MIAEIKEAMLAVSNSLIASTLTKITVTIALGLIGARMARRSRASVRHAMLAVSFGALLLLPLASIVAPPVRIALRLATPAPTVPPPVPGAAGAVSPIRRADAGKGVTAAISRSPVLSPSALLLAGWSVGAALFLLPMTLGLWQVRSLRQRGLPWQHGQSVVDGLALDAGIHRRVTALLYDSLPGPMTCGVVHPVIVLPLDARNWERDDLNRAIVHELEHVQRRDWLSHCLARTLCALYWFHPLVWMAWRQLALEAERACDDAVLGRSEATAYADQLVGLARRLSKAAKSPLLAMANRADLPVRVEALLDSRQRRGRAGVFPVALACAAGAVLVLTISPLRMVAAPQAASADAQGTALPRFSSNTMLVMEDVTVSDQSGNSIDGLKPSDLAITEDGAPQTISVFEFQKLAGSAPGISSYYILGYYPSNLNVTDEFRNIKVTFKGDPTATLKHRPGYYFRKFTRAGVPLPVLASADSPLGLDASVPVALYKKAAEYSEEARKAKYQGKVLLNVEIDTSGQVTNISEARTLGLGLDEKAIEAVKQWKFRPGMKDGRLIPVQAQVEVNFRLL